MTLAAPGDNWWGVLLDGFAGGLIGAAATITVVVMTIRHERKMREGERLDAAIATAHADIGTWVMHTAGRDALHTETLGPYRAMLQSIAMATTRAQSVEPALAQLLTSASLNLGTAAQTVDRSAKSLEDLQAAVIRVHIVLGRWLSEPQLIRDRVLDYNHVVRLQGIVDADGTFQDLGLTPLKRRQRLWRRLRRGPKRSAKHQ
jgi:hypothetical protein